MAGTVDGRNVDLLKGVRVLIVEDAWHVAKALKSTLDYIEHLIDGDIYPGDATAHHDKTEGLGVVGCVPSR